ncbi:Zn-ribbon domain-containing OB-fold protein [Georgenia subflava]|uniref:Zn-ribbon domain-containing OB-fold protein n=1 Tax=Georgenia subflava TaxID=1622177 RepID=UPI00128B24D4|nr:Zn-ribbon domain-containing OB-fold protein [Georgenia subflava]
MSIADTVEVVDLAPAERFSGALAEGRLELPFCTRCQSLVWYPRARCPVCMTGITRWVELSRRGTVYSYTVNRRPPRNLGPGPVVIAYVELDEGPRILAQVVGVSADAVHIGAGVELAPAGSTSPRLAFALDTAVNGRDGAGQL